MAAATASVRWGTGFLRGASARRGGASCDPAPAWLPTRSVYGLPLSSPPPHPRARRARFWSVRAARRPPIRPRNPEHSALTDIPTPAPRREHSNELVLQRVQPALLGLMDGSVSTLAPLFAA